jgi:hypothetical protein
MSQARFTELAQSQVRVVDKPEDPSEPCLCCGIAPRGAFREYAGNMQGTCSERSVFSVHSGNIQGTFREHSWNTWGTFSVEGTIQ